MDHINFILSGILIYFTSFIIIIAVHLYKRGKVPGAPPLFFLCLATAFYTFGYSMELLSQTIEEVDFWSKFQYLGIPFIPAIWVIVSVSYAKATKKHNKAFYLFLFIIPVLTLFFRLTSAEYHLQYAAMRMVSNGYFPVLDFVKGPWYYLNVVYFILCALYSSLNYGKVHSKTSGYLRKQSRIMIAASILPVFSLIINIMDIFPLKLDSGPLFAIINFLILTYGIFRYNLLNLIPLSRKKVFDWIYDGVLVLDLQGNIVDFNRAAYRIFPELSLETTGTHIKECLGKYPGFINPLISWLDRFKNSGMEKSINGGPGNSYEFEIPDKKDYRHHYHVRMSKLYQKDFLFGFTLLITDITKQHTLLQQLEYRSRTDSLTGLFNRRYFNERMKTEISRATRIKSCVALILADIDNFKKINDTWGHLAGDRVLIMFSCIAAQCVRAADLVGRFGGEEFIIFLPDTGLENAVQIADRIRSLLLAADIHSNGKFFQISASFGVTAFNFADDRLSFDYETMFSKADEALYRAKKHGKNRVEAIAYDV